MSQRKGQIIQNLNAVDGLGKVFHHQDFISDGPVRPEIDIGIFPAGGTDFVQLNLFQSPFPGGCLLGLGSVRGEALDKLLQFFDLLFLLLVGFLHLTDHQLGRLVPEIIVSCIQLDLPVIDIRDIGTDLVQEIAVMRHNDHRILKIDQEFLQPADGVQIQMVGRLVQQQDIRVAEQGSGQQDLYLFTAGQLLHEQIMFFRLNAQSVQERFRIGLGFPAVHFRKFRFQLAGPDAVFIGEILLCIKRILLPHDLKQACIAHHDRIQHLVLIIFEMILLQEGKPLAGRHVHGSVGGVQLSGKNLQEC